MFCVTVFTTVAVEAGWSFLSSTYVVGGPWGKWVPQGSKYILYLLWGLKPINTTSVGLTGAAEVLCSLNIDHSTMSS